MIKMEQQNREPPKGIPVLLFDTGYKKGAGVPAPFEINTLPANRDDHPDISQLRQRL
jgi:hypothetical protein